jgi:hypothetical protein
VSTQWCQDTVELDGRDPNHPAVIDCERKLTDKDGRHRSHDVHKRTLELQDGRVVELRWTRGDAT